MSNRTLVELNHDMCPQTDREFMTWARRLQAYLRTGYAEALPSGVTFVHTRHHSEPCPVRGENA